MQNYKVFDISWPINKDTVEYKNKGVLNIKTVKDVQHDDVHETHMTLDMHTGTHIDAPKHLIRDAQTVDQISFDHLLGYCKVLDLTHVEEKIVESDLHGFDIEENDIILFKTKNSFFSDIGKFEPNFIYLDKTGAQYLASKKVKTVGIDYLGIERNQPGHETHKTLFGSNIIIIEGVRLTKVKQGQYFIICLPIKIEMVEAACSRAILLSLSDA